MNELISGFFPVQSIAPNPDEILPSEEEIIIYVTRVVRKIRGNISNRDIISLLLFKIQNEPNPDLQERYREALQRIIQMDPIMVN